VPRKSSAALGVVPIGAPRRARLVPSEAASPEVLQVFREILAAAPQGHFSQGDEHLIESFAQAVVLARKASAELSERGPVIEGRTSPWIVVLEKQHRAISAISARLRLSPQHRADSRSAGRRADGPRPSVYEVMANEYGDED
jgi:hypothetical protein